MARLLNKKALVFLAVFLTLSMAFVGLNAVTEDSDAGTNVYGRAYFSTSASASGKISGSDTSTGSTIQTLYAGETYHFYLKSTTSSDISSSATWLNDSLSSYSSSSVSISA